MVGYSVAPFLLSLQNIEDSLRGNSRGLQRHIETQAALLVWDGPYMYRSTKSPVTNEEKTMISRSPSQKFLMLGTVLAGAGVAAGAFGAHALKEILDAPMLQVFETATRYLMYHAFGLCVVSWAIDRYPTQGLQTSGWLFLVGMLLFSGSLYGVSLAGLRWLGAVTPVGGLAFIIGWFLLGWGVWREKQGGV